MPDESPEPKSQVQPPSLNGWNKADIVGKILLGVAGLALSVAVAVDGVSNRRQETQRKEDETRAVREERLVKEFQAYYGWAHTSRDNAAVALLDLDMASSIAQILAAPPYGRGMFNGAIGPYRQSLLPPQKPADVQDAVVSPNEFQAKETLPAGAQAQAAVPAAGVEDSGWFAVLRSFDASPSGCREAFAFAGRVPAGLARAEVWKTRISNSYAVVSGGKVQRELALGHAQAARRAGFASDAFTQVDRGWSPVPSCG